MIEINDLIEPRAKQILLAALPPLLRSHARLPLPITGRRRNHARRFEGTLKSILQGNDKAPSENLQMPLLC
jgi:hypothetical protein